MTIPSDLEISRSTPLKPLPDIAAQLGIGSHLLEPHGRNVAKISLEAIDELAGNQQAKYVVVSAITPTPLGEGKTTTTIGLGQALHHLGKRSAVAVRQPSMGPTFGIKGGAAGGVARGGAAGRVRGAPIFRPVRPRNLPPSVVIPSAARDLLSRVTGHGAPG